MGDSNVDIDNVANLTISEEDPPPILRSGIHEVFYQYGLTLDIQSFMNLAMTSKEMYKRCMNDKMIKIHLKEMTVSVAVANGVPMFSFHSFDIADIHIEKYLQLLRQLRCNVSLRKIHFQADRTDAASITQLSRYLSEIGVKNIDSLKIDGECTGWQEIPSFINDFHIKNVDINRGLSDEVLCSLLQTNRTMSSFSYDGPIQGEMLLDIDSSISHITLPSMQLSADVLVEILKKIQSGALKKLSVSWVPWDNFTSVYSDQYGPLPDERPLFIKTRYFPTGWFLHSNRSVTECHMYNTTTNFSKCEEKDFPAVLHSEVQVHKALVEKRQGFRCLPRHFASFFDGIPVLDASHKGPFPEERPLHCKPIGTDYSYHLLNEDGSIDVYSLLCQALRVDHYDLQEEWPLMTSHMPLNKFLFGKRIEKRVENGFYCKNSTDFPILFEDYETLPHDFRGQLPERRPLVFVHRLITEELDFNANVIEETNRILFYEDGSLIHYSCTSSAFVEVIPCPTWCFPSMMITTEILKEIIREAPLRRFSYSIDFDMFRDAFEGIVSVPFNTSDDLPSERPLILKRNELCGDEIIDQRWMLLENGDVRKCEWKNGRASFSPVYSPEFPLILTKAVLTGFFKGKHTLNLIGFFIEHDALMQCLEDCVVYPFDNPYPHWEERPIIFKKTEVKHRCHRNPDVRCECSEEILNLCFVSAKEEVIHVACGPKEERHVLFDHYPHSCFVPPVLKTKKALEFLLQADWAPGEWKIKWYGKMRDFVSYLEDHRMVDDVHEGRWPKTRPLVVKATLLAKYNSYDDGLLYWYHREDGVCIECEHHYSHSDLTISVPPPLVPSI